MTAQEMAARTARLHLFLQGVNPTLSDDDRLWVKTWLGDTQKLVEYRDLYGRTPPLTDEALAKARLQIARIDGPGPISGDGV